jgi:hypothetical protein
MWTDIHSKILIANSTYLVHMNFLCLNCPEILKQIVWKLQYNSSEA